jgi:hypothetical protein
LPEGRDPKTLPTRQDKILQFLAAAGRKDKSFADTILAKSPLDMYRFGPVLDEADAIRLHPNKDKSFAFNHAAAWLKPDENKMKAPDVTGLSDEVAKQKSAEFGKRIEMLRLLKTGTNIGGSLLQMHKIENNSHIQAVVLFSDGQSNLGTEDIQNQVRERFNNPKRPIPLFTVGVGEFRMPVSIRIEDLQAPAEVRPDDKFSVRVPVVSTGLQGEEFPVILQLQRKKDVTGVEVVEEPIVLPEGKGVFKGAGDLQQGIVPFEIDLAKLKGFDDPAKDTTGVLEGEWEFKAKTPRHKNEPFPDPEHWSDVVTVTVQKRALRVLLFAGAATREYQFLRTVLYREMNEKRMEMSICNQQNFRDENVDQDVPAERFLSDFPNRIGPNEPGKQFMSLSDYDVIVCFDPDWTRLSNDQRAKLHEWVTEHGGGIIFVAGPVSSYQLARPGGQDFTKILPLYPVVLKDNRLHGLVVSGAGGHDATRPYALQLSPTPKQFDFLKLDDSHEDPTTAWNLFFWNKEKVSEQEMKEGKPKRGFYTYYPVERLKAGTAVAAVFLGPKESRIGEKNDVYKDMQPFIATMIAGAGKTMHIGSGELWRLRAFKDGYYERLWIKMARHVSTGVTQQKKYGRILMARSLPAGRVEFEAQVRGKSMEPLPQDEPPTVIVKRVDRGVGEPGKDKKDGKAPDTGLKPFPLKAKLGDGAWQGYFIGGITLTEPGEYEFVVPIKNLEPKDYLRQNLIIRKPNPELDNVRTNFGYLYQLASESKGVMERLPDDVKKELEPLLQAPGDASETVKGTKRLFFQLSSADAIAKCIRKEDPKTDIIKGRFEDLWDRSMDTGREVYAYYAALVAPLVVGLIGVLILVFLRQFVAALAFFGICLLMSIGVFITDFIFTSLFADMLDVNFSYTLLIIVSLLGIEWLSRKLLRLA